MTVMTALVLAFTLGLGAARLEQGGLRRGLDDLRKVIVMVIGNVLIPLLPLYIFGIFTYSAPSNLLSAGKSPLLGTSPPLFLPIQLALASSGR